MKEQTPIYHHSGSHAYEHGEVKQYRASYQENVACKEMIEQAIAAHYHDNRLNPACVNSVLERFGYERVFYVLANTVQQKEWDGRIAPDNKVWAKAIPVTSDQDGFGGNKNIYFTVDRCNPGLTDLFLTQVRKEYVLKQEGRTSVRASLCKGTRQQDRTEKAKKNKAQER